MDILLLFFSAGAICVTIGGLGLYFTTKKRLDDIEGSLKSVDSELTTHKKDINNLKKGNAKKPEFIYIVTDETPGDDVKIGGF